MELTSFGNELFNPGELYMTNGISYEIQDTNEEGFHYKAVEVWNSLARHLDGDWGDLGEEDKKLNEEALKNEDRLFSMYNCKHLGKIYIITEWDRSCTTILFPYEY